LRICLEGNSNKAVGRGQGGARLGSDYNDAVSGTVQTVAEEELPSARRPFTVAEKFLLTVISWAVYVAVRLIAPTLRYSVSCEENSPTSLQERPFVYSFWHQCIFPAVYLWRNLEIRVMSSTSFDGEFTARMIRRFGFVPVRGSSSRGAVRGLLGLRREIAQGYTAAFTIDGPRGPRFVTKPGPVLLARSSRTPMAVFHIALENPWILRTWDALLIPKPFSKALMRVGTLIPVPEDMPAEELENYHQRLQSSLDRVKAWAEANVHRVGADLPIFQRTKEGGIFPAPG
jgi:lysophospholipid acyltransferase (LPLAT)-like uncharacterized protein